MTDTASDTDRKRTRTTVLGPLRVSETEAETIRKKAADTGLSLAAYRRHMLLNGRVSVIKRQTGDQPETARQLLKIGNNLNQIAKRGNQLGVVDRQELADLVSQIRAAVEFVTRD